MDLVLSHGRSSSLLVYVGLSKMAESCPGTTYAKLSWLQAWHIRDETYSSALGELVNAQLRQAAAGNWGDGATSSSDGQRFKDGGKAESTGHINPKYGAEPSRLFSKAGLLMHTDHGIRDGPVDEQAWTLLGQRLQ